MVKKIILLILLVFIIGCTPEPMELEDKRGKAPGMDSQSTIDDLKHEIDRLLESNSWLSEDHYNRILSDLERFEREGEDVSELREKITQLSVSGMQKEKAQEEIIPEQETAKLPTCTGTEQYTHQPVDLDLVKEISPLGSLNPPGHTIPTEHTYLHMGDYNTNDIYSLHSPGKIYITGIAQDKDDIAPDRKEYNIQFALCEDLTGYFNHVKELRGVLKEEFAKAECEQWTVNPGNICQKNMLVALEPGVEIGGVGHNQGNFDIGALDYNIKLNFVNPEQYGKGGGQTIYKVCPYDYYTPELKEKFYSLLKSVSEPKCGEVMQDVAGTLAGNWFAVDKSWENPANWDKQLSFAHDNSDHSKLMISIGGHFTEASKWQIGTSSGDFINRPFAEVTPDGNIYCYTGTNPYAGYSEAVLSTAEHTGKIIVQMISDIQLKIEKQTGSCTGQEQFEEPFVYNR